MMGFGICWDERERRWEGCALKEGHVYARHGMCMRYEGGRDGGGIGGLEFLSLLSIQCVCVCYGCCAFFHCALLLFTHANRLAMTLDNGFDLLPSFFYEFT